MRECDRVADLDEDAEVPLEHVLGPKLLAHALVVLDEVDPALALDALHHDQGLCLAVEDQVVHRDHVGVLERAEDPRLLDQGLADALGVRGVDVPRLDRDRPPERDLLGELDHAHASRAELALHVEAVGGVRSERLEPLERLAAPAGDARPGPVRDRRILLRELPLRAPDRAAPGRP